MSETLLLIRAHINELDLSGLEDYYLASRERLASVDGALGFSMWREVDSREGFLVIFEYRDVEAAESGLKALAGIRLLAESQTADYHPADVLRLRTEFRSGGRVSDSPKPGYLSLSVRVADPGFGNELFDEVTVIFQELAFIPGFAGSLVGCSDVLAEEVVGIVTWSSRAAFEASLPPHQRMYDVKLYERVF